MKRVIHFALCVGLIGASGCTAPTEKVNLITNSKSNPVVIPPNCPDWSIGNNFNYGNTPSSNYGCANITNYGAMVQDPNDMITGKSSDYTDSARSAVMVGRYRTGSGGGAAAAAPSGQ